MDVPSDEVEMVQLAYPADGKLILKKNSLSTIFEEIRNVPVSTINIVGPPSSGKSLLLSFFARCLEAAERDEYDWVDSSNPERPMTQIIWPDAGKSSGKPGIWVSNRHFTLQVGEGSKRKKIAVLLLYTQSSQYTFWDAESADIADLMGLSLLISSTTIFNIYKNLNEQCLSAVANSIKYAVHGLPRNGPPKKGKASTSPPVPFQNSIFLVRDWNFPTEFPYGIPGGKKFVQGEKLREKPGHSKASRQSRQLINGLFQSVGGCLLPYPGNVVASDEFTGSIAEMDQKFSKYFTDFIGSVVNVDQLPVKKDPFGDPITGEKLKEILEAYVARDEDTNVSQMNPCTILRRFKIKVVVHPEEQKEYIKSALKVYTEIWKRSERGTNYFEEREIANIHRRAKNKAVEAFENEMKPKGGEDEDDDEDEYDDGDDDEDDGAVTTTIDRNIRKLLNDRIAKRFEEVKQENLKRKGAYLELCKTELLQQYRESMEATYPEGGKVPSENAVKKESKDSISNISGEYLERMGANGDVDNLDDEQEQDLKKFSNMLKAEEKVFLDGLFGRKNVVEVEENEDSSDDSIVR